jgi:predicted regulator of Ras-like GTPase activity (Roadblock/LC7/MglB family)
MQQVLNELNKTSGVTGSMLVGDDGIVIASDLHSSVEGETVGALAASITVNVRKALERMETSSLKQVTIEAEDAKMFFTDAGFGVLVVTAEKNVNIGLIRLEIKNAIGNLRSMH